MPEIITFKDVYKELKTIERNIATKEEMKRIIETIEIMPNPNTMEQIRQSEEDILAGRVKEIRSVMNI